MNSPFTPELLQLITDNKNAAGRPLLFGNANIVTTDPLIGNVDRGDVLLGGSRIVGIGPGLMTAADDDGAIAIDCAGLTLVPAIIDTPRILALRPKAHRPAGAIAPGNPATFALVPTKDGETGDDVLRRLLDTPEDALVVFADGAVLRWAGAAVPAADVGSNIGASEPSDGHPLLGTWIDENDFVRQHLTGDGRYDETRGGRPHAYQGDFWITGNRIDYRDDLGFWAFGEFADGNLHHAGYTFHRA
ncbi:Atu4866 domain-containing protein [Curtobacterium sp. VKM Ac-2887]|uniref:Atu4866 domain-containing protein n=1 Tax=Curtobacterium sp. VKM Ac-2887 TaxID=2783819 RepID=UPI00188B5AAA|nr:Atu4866 domain-containing protein [Curtobacterium sp. VKM Ac-2887]MBF4588230.1 Atu4866 domain-containing protein [Curtobacterium sp. VKM Ac-2887]